MGVQCFNKIRVLLNIGFELAAILEYRFSRKFRQARLGMNQQVGFHYGHLELDKMRPGNQISVGAILKHAINSMISAEFPREIGVGNNGPSFPQ